ncbi:MAG: lipoyl(octanoyl) transferase LipB [Phycisphaerae bacterium]|nr:lipoyl(octanoyl) transferase LipB [Phycisphaerae bacterium]
MSEKAVPLDIRDCGLMPYAAALALQMELCAQRQADAIANTVLVVEHPPVITLGARKSENKLMLDEAALAAAGVEVAAVGRGGGTTAHNPGQLVFYPIIKLKTLGLGVSEYIRRLEGIGIELLAGLGVESGRRKGYPGLWVGDKKIASIGVQIKKWVTFHGMAINLTNDLAIFEAIVPCGLDGVMMTSARQETGRPVDMAAAKIRLAGLCRACFEKRSSAEPNCV